MRYAFVIGLAALVVAQQAQADTMQTGAAINPPAVAVYMDSGIKRPAHKPDCNDAAMANATHLRAEGYQPRYATAFTETGEGHMVVTFDYLGSTYVLDNRMCRGGWGCNPKPTYWRDLPYKWISRQDADHKFMWDQITNS